MKRTLPLYSAFVVFLQLLAGGIFLNIAAQEPQQSPEKERLEQCTNNLTVQVSQMKQISQIKKNKNLDQAQKLEQISQILTPEQKQQLKSCMKG